MSRFIPVVAGLLVGSALIAGHAALAQTEGAPQTEKPAEKSLRQCVSGGDLDTTVIDEKTLLVEERGRGAMVMKVSGCRLNNFDPLLFEYRGSTQICNPIDVQMSVIYAPGFKSACFVDTLKPVSFEEAKSLKASLSKKKKK
ncbi:hypothetical protein Q1W73_15755 [Asticcacaulis sp. ZE23SCel15]|uniref:hypothetical protein n=1 Tax=Asticcacaulis sp. ZE23SCel15 TaxID=3059027 RepID=UPI00265DAC1D|nr:hypothetical protein [Asticcacaulis sp. ZE23SCel15]WKL57099.1 hypothetical protein Q1W73_15755 [Asticcacaulis sp. ZE23SCel15]